MSERPITLLKRQGNTATPAVLVDGLKPIDLVMVEREWLPDRLAIHQELLKKSIPRTEWPQSLHWNWESKALQLKFIEATGLGITVEGKWQGVMLTKTASHVTRSPEDRGKPIVYVDYLETAPWNWRVDALGMKGLFRGVGVVLFHEAVVQSIREGFNGRVGLHALPQSEGFYANACGMTAIGKDPNKQNLSYFELSRLQAKQLLAKGGGK